VSQVCFQGFLIVYLIVHLILLAVDNARRHESETREYDMDVDSETIMGCASGMFPMFIIVNAIAHLILSYHTGHRSITDHPSPVHRQPVVDSVLPMNELGNDRESLGIFFISFNRNA
jgi:hypothetical protein